MKDFTQKQYRELQEQAAKALDQVGEGTDIREILAGICVDQLEGKSTAQGLVMADEILLNVRQFDSDYSEAQKDLDKYIDRILEKLGDEKTCVEKCNLYLKMAVAISAVSDQTGKEPVDTDAVKNRIEEMEIPEEAASAELERNLRDRLKEALRSNGIMLSTFFAQEQLLEEIESEDEAAELLLDYGGKEVEYRAIVSMLAYTNIKNGNFRNMPADMTAAQTTTLVCAQMEELRIAEAVGSGRMAVEVAQMLLSILGIVSLTLFAGITMAGFVYAASVLTVEMIPLLLAWMILLLYGAYGIDKKLGENVAVGVKTVRKGLKALKRYAASAIANAQARISEQLRQLSAGSRKRAGTVDVEDVVTEE